MNPAMPCAKPAKRAYLFTNHAPEQIVSGYENISSFDDIIAVDSGLITIHKLGLAPCIIIGDMDSVPPELLLQYASTPIMRRPAEKKETDTELALLWCMRQACYDTIIICNDMQGRFDHAMAIVQNLLMASTGSAKVQVETANQTLFLLEPVNRFHNLRGKILSLLPLSDEVKFISSVGLKYPLDALLIKQYQSRGVSNEFIADEAEIIKHHGDVLAIITISN
jgi:thiamine pyrophosphokinase